MIANVMCRLSAFADYSILTYDSKDVTKVMNAFDKYNFAPSQIQEVSSQGFITQRMGFSDMKNHISVVINEQRMDLTRVAGDKQGFNGKDLIETNELFLEIYRVLYDIFKDRAPIPHRLAWYTNYVIFEMTDEKKKEFRDKFLKELVFSTKTDVWMIC